MHPARVNREPDIDEMRVIQRRKDEAAFEAAQAVRMMHAVNVLAINSEGDPGTEIAAAKLYAADVLLLLSRRAIEAFDTYDNLYHEVMAGGGER